jgi:membrane protein DedA with SNARE-associated domain
MGSILQSRRARHGSGAIVLLCLSLVWPAAQAQTPISHGLQASVEHVEGDLRDAVIKMQPTVERYGYAGVAGMVSVEGFGMPAPGQSMLMAAALEAARGHLRIELLLALAVLAAVAGNSLGYVIGKRGGRPLLRKLRVNEAREEKIGALFERYGGGFILLARFLDGPRQLNGIIAGVLEMRWWIFTAFNVAGAVLWVGIWGLGTYYLSEHLRAIDGFLRQINPWVGGLVVVGVLAMLVYLFRGRRPAAD